MTQYGFYFDATRCTGCKTCEAACRDYHDLPLELSHRHVYELEGGSWSQASDGTWTTDSYTYYTSFSCSHCANPACMHVCPTGAMHKDDNGIVSVDAHRCIGCGYCELACPTATRMSTAPRAIASSATAAPSAWPRASSRYAWKLARCAPSNSARWTACRAAARQPPWLRCPILA